MRDLGNLGVKVLHYEFQYSPHLCFVHPAEPLDEVVDSRALRQVAEKGRHGQPGARENPVAPLTRPGTLSTAGHLLQSVIRSPPLRLCTLALINHVESLVVLLVTPVL